MLMKRVSLQKKNPATISFSRFAIQPSFKFRGYYYLIFLNSIQHTPLMIASSRYELIGDFENGEMCSINTEDHFNPPRSHPSTFHTALIGVVMFIAGEVSNMVIMPPRPSSDLYGQYETGFREE